MGILIAAAMATAISLLAIGGILAWRSTPPERKILAILILAQLPCSSLLFYGTRSPLDLRLEHWIADPQIRRFLSFLFRPVLEELLKLWPLLIPWICQSTTRDRTLWRGLASGLGFGVGELWLLTSIVYWHDPVTANLDLWSLFGFVNERAMVCLIHGALTAIALQSFVGPESDRNDRMLDSRDSSRNLSRTSAAMTPEAKPTETKTTGEKSLREKFPETKTTVTSLRLPAGDNQSRPRQDNSTESSRAPSGSSPGILVAIGLHALANLPFFLRDVLAFGLSSGAWGMIVRGWVVGYFFAMVSVVWLMAGGEFHVIWLLFGDATCPYCGMVYPRATLSWTLRIIHYDRCPRCQARNPHS